MSGVELPFPVVQLAFRIFDSNGEQALLLGLHSRRRYAYVRSCVVVVDNGTLDQSELLKVLEMRTDIELQKKKPETVVKRFWSCIKEAPHH